MRLRITCHEEFFKCSLVNQFEENLPYLRVTHRSQSLTNNIERLVGGECFTVDSVGIKSMENIGDLKNTDLVMNNTFFIGLFPGIGRAQIDYVLEVFEEFFKRT